MLWSLIMPQINIYRSQASPWYIPSSNKDQEYYIGTDSPELSVSRNWLQRGNAGCLGQSTKHDQSWRVYRREVGADNDLHNQFALLHCSRGAWCLTTLNTSDSSFLDKFFKNLPESLLKTFPWRKVNWRISFLSCSLSTLIQVFAMTSYRDNRCRSSFKASLIQQWFKPHPEIWKSSSEQSSSNDFMVYLRASSSLHDPKETNQPDAEHLNPQVEL